jgi:glycosyltransferase involved in cell wall biosynthesis
VSKISFVAWVRYDRRPELLARRLGGTLHNVIHGSQGKLWQAPVRYAAQARETWRLLRRERPDVVYVQNPPIFAAIVVAWYARRSGARFIIDSHTSAFQARRWRWSLGMHRWLSRRALTTIVHNAAQAEIVAQWGAPYTVLGFVFGDYPAGTAFSRNGKFVVAVVSTFEKDEPLDLVFEAARNLPAVSFYVTGDSKRAAPGLLVQKPENCHLTGFMDYDEYIGLLRGADAVMDLTTRDHTLLMGGFEAVALGKPLITSDWPILRSYFSAGTVHVPNTVEGITDGVQQARRHPQELRQEMQRMRDELMAEWEEKSAELWELVHGHDDNRRDGQYG